MFNDDRGKIYFPVKNGNFNVKETVVSVNHKNVFRGIHVEQFFKLVTCVQGKILDIIINFDKNADDYLIPKYYTLDSNTNNNQILIHPNFGHAFLSLEENSIVIYHFSDVFDADKTICYNYMDPIFNINLPVVQTPSTTMSTGFSPIISNKDLNSPFFRDIDFYVFGGNGFIGSVIMNSVSGNSVYKTKLRLEEVDKIEKELDLYKPKFVICSAGLTGTPNISWCETHKTETIETNITYQMTLAHLCRKKNIHLTIIGSGVIFKNDRYYTEEDEGNYDGNFYGKCRISLENMAKIYDNVLYARINYPISKHCSSKNLITKMQSYSSIDNVDITLTYIDELIPYLIDMSKKGVTGICNLVNEGAISLVDIMEIYETKKGIINKKPTNIENKNRSTSLLTIGKLQNYNVMNVKTAVTDCITNYISYNNEL